MKLKLEDVFELQMGKTPSRNDDSLWNGGIPWCSIADLSKSSKYLIDTKETLSEKGVNTTGIKVVPANTVIMSFKLSIGKAAIAKNDLYTNEAIMAFIDKGIYDIDLDYMYHYCKGHNWTSGVNKAVMGLTLNKATIKKHTIDLPSLDEQKLIAAKLDKIDSLIGKNQQMLDKLDLMVKSRFNEMFGDLPDNTPWSNVFSVKTGKLDSNAMVENGKYPFFTCAKDYYWIDTYAFDCEALLLAGNNAAGKYDVKYYKGKFNAYQRTYVLQLLNNNWAYPVFKHQLEQKLYYLQQQSKGSNTKYLTLGILNQLRFCIPLIDQQKSFSKFTEKVDKSKFMHTYYSYLYMF